MDFQLTEEQQYFRRLVRDFAEAGTETARPAYR